VLGDGDYKGATFEHVKEGRLPSAEQLHTSSRWLVIRLRCWSEPCPRLVTCRS
jgi:hypothetical protein